MQFAIYCLDKDGHTQTRLDNRPAHVDHLKAHNAELILAGDVLRLGDGRIGDAVPVGHHHQPGALAARVVVDQHAGEGAVADLPFDGLRLHRGGRGQRACGEHRGGGQPLPGHGKIHGIAPAVGSASVAQDAPRRRQATPRPGMAEMASGSKPASRAKWRPRSV